VVEREDLVELAGIAQDARTRRSALEPTMKSEHAPHAGTVDVTNAAAYT
jgi:hypothetical protein